MNKRGVVTSLRRNFFVSEYRKTLWVNPFVIQKTSDMENFLNNRGDATFSRRKFYVSQYRKASWGNTFVFQTLCCMEKNSKKRCLSRFSVQVV